jgi:hypothetical protein
MPVPVADRELRYSLAVTGQNLPNNVLDVKMAACPDSHGSDIDAGMLAVPRSL